MRVAVTDNRAGEGGGIITSRTLRLTESVVRGNDANSVGGGIFIDTGTVTLETGSSVGGDRLKDGSSAISGMGIYINFDGSLTPEDGSRVTGNTATSEGGGIFNASDGTVTLAPGALVCGNTAPSGADCFGAIDGACPQLPSDGICPV